MLHRTAAPFTNKPSSQTSQKQHKKIKVFTKSLTSTDIDKRLSIPTQSLAFLPPFGGSCTVELCVRDENRRVYRFICRVRKTGYLKPVLSEGWRSFVHERRLKVGDKVSFFQEEDYGDGIKVFGAVFPHSGYKIEVDRAAAGLEIQDQTS